MTEREDTIERIERVLNLTHKNSITVTIPRLTAERAVYMLKEQEAKPMIENERGWNCPSCGMELIGKTASGYPYDLIDLPLNFCPRCGQEVEYE